MPQAAQRKFEIETFLPSALVTDAPVPFARFASRVLLRHQDALKRLMESEKKVGPFSFSQFESEYKTDMANDPAKSYTTYTIKDQDDFWNATRLVYLASNLDFHVEEWSMTFGSTFDFEAGRHNVKDILPLITPWLLDKNQDQDLNLSMDTHLGIPPDSSQCELLRQKSLKALATIVTWPTASAPVQPAPISSGPPQSLGRCIGCHVIGEATPIPFDSSKLLKGAFNNPASTNPEKNLFQELLIRLDSGNMPPNSALTSSEKSELKELF